MRVLQTASVRAAVFVFAIFALVPSLAPYAVDETRAAGATLTATPTSARPSEIVTVKGAGFPSGLKFRIRFDGSSDGMPQLITSSSGSFSTKVTVPQAATAGTHMITATKTRKGITTVLATTSIVVDTTATDGGGTTAPPSAPTTKMFAYYYLWWSLGHWQDKLGSAYPYDRRPLPLPATVDAGGCNPVSLYSGNELIDVPAALYTQDDATVIERDVRDAAASGLTGFLVNWRGTGSSSQTSTSSGYNRRLDLLVNTVNRLNANGYSFRLWLDYGQSHNPTATQRANDWAYLEQKYASNPAFSEYDGRPVLVWNDTSARTTTEIQDLTARFRATFYIVGTESRSSWTTDRSAAFDGGTYYWSSQNPYTNPHSFDQLAELATRVRSTGGRWFAPLAPGYNHILGGGSSCVPRNDGETMRLLFAGNSRSNPDAWMLISWNEIGESSHVQPLQRWGSTYLNMIKGLTGVE